MADDETTKIALFRQREIRKVLHSGQWWFVIVDVVAALTDSESPTDYLKNIRKRDAELAKLMESVDKGGVKLTPPLFFVTHGYDRW